MKKFLQLIACIFIFQFAQAQNDSLKGGDYYASNFIIDDVQRNFFYYMPVNYGKKDLYSLVIFLHHEGESAKNFIKKYGDTIQAMADTSDAVVIYPDAVAAHWNDKLGEHFPATDTINDVGFISILIDYFRNVYGCDPQRVYVAGLFNGGKLAYHLICDIPAKLTAVAPFTNMTEVANKCNSDKSVAIMNTSDLIDQTSKKLTPDAIKKVWKFFMSKTKK